MLKIVGLEDKTIITLANFLGDKNKGWLLLGL